MTAKLRTKGTKITFGMRAFVGVHQKDNARGLATRWQGRFFHLSVLSSQPTIHTFTPPLRVYRLLVRLVIYILNFGQVSIFLAYDMEPETPRSNSKLVECSGRLPMLMHDVFSPRNCVHLITSSCSSHPPCLPSLMSRLFATSLRPS